ncbi:Oligopeptide ABC transporter, periplasmic oligopeptide-binding protein OppA [Rubellimicrobium mesophilum DSM 19309]|uniref:Oligopeptide ABC transporter, periplasmic oligopeptide-binding protein OppA n=1 Tax=Rubellimicrobium mesophilum DSM 19309 TaxID=442562 RepID=A0A017HJJ6_9RHOB|nr:extracellular solute-binding protein [Rubellimicrobium mesophilum]EYD74511.1 Oligopeptide ABC transporter, periplasmic oligopeptide-binding protein OppA [Rubellimicrobium mesophilum DSM 19309]
MPQARTLALTRSLPSPRLGLSFLALAGVLWAWEARAQEAAAGTEPATAEGTQVAAATAADQPAPDQQTTVSHGYNFFGDLKYPADFAHYDYVNPDAPKGGEISIWAQGTFDNMNPYATKEGNPGALSSVGYESIMEAPADEVGSLYCLLCETIEYPADRSWVIFHLRPGVTFSDGTPMTAEDVAFSHDLLITQGTESFRYVVSKMIPTVEVIDPLTVRFDFSPDFSPQDTIPQAAATPVFSKAWYDRTGARLDESRFDISPGTGPYVLDSYDQNRRITYRRNPDYWGQDLPINVGRNNFDRIRVEYFSDPTAAMEAFKAGEYTFRLENSSLQWATAYDFPALDQGYVVRETLDDGSLPGASGFIFNMTREKLQDRRVRQALALMYNFTWTNETLQYGLFEQRASFWQGTDLAAQGVPGGRELELLQSVADKLPPEILTEPVTMPHESGERQLDRGNLRKALALLEEAGWVTGNDGLLRNDAGETLQVEFLSSNPSFDRILLPYVDNLKTLGVDATYTRVDDAQYTERTNNFDFDMIYDGYVNSLEEGESLGQRYGSSGVGDIFNPASYSNPAVDALIPYVAKATTREEMAAGVRAIDRILRYDLFEVPTWFKANHWVAYWDMYDHPETIPPYSLGYLDFWWYDEAGAKRLHDAGALR